MKYEFAIKKETLNSGKIVYTPVCRVKTTLSFLGELFSNPWMRIVKAYDKYFLLDLHFNPDLTEIDCINHIEGYKKVIDESVASITSITDFQNLEFKEVNK